ncbi:hypothetical protein THAOC_09781 [Thalassiosira oceanica]|uniref:Uncharacterized protein n=1 Tax=Thalassiosira oceanica TaxID=159749 RepID=K0SUB2_THAOC|nr:hypothetical protein THAOC_09781 [Thalassiosira oceanica]|eukprot:EJK69005.1 hypothetical protein THAOC_09781 [Thalassiosira oceanica]
MVFLGRPSKTLRADGGDIDSTPVENRRRLIHRLLGVAVDQIFRLPGVAVCQIPSVGTQTQQVEVPVDQMVTNTTAIAEALSPINRNFDLRYAATLEKDYEEVGRVLPDLLLGGGAYASLSVYAKSSSALNIEE